MARAPAAPLHSHPGPPPELPELPESVERARRWAPWTAPVALVAGLVIAVFGGIAIAVVGVVFGGSLTKPPAAVQVAGTIFQDLALIGSAVAFASLSGVRPRPAQFGLRSPASGRGAVVAWVVLAWLSFLLFSIVWTVALNIKDKEHVLHDLGADRSSVALVAVAVLVSVVAPICEEVFFRGFFFTALSNWRGIWPAAVVTGLCFGAVHAGGTPAVFLVPLAYFGFVQCLLYRRTRSLYPCIALHVVNNSFALGLSEHWGWEIPVVMAGALAVVALIVFPAVRWLRPAPVVA